MCRFRFLRTWQKRRPSHPQRATLSHRARQVRTGAVQLARGECTVDKKNSSPPSACAVCRDARSRATGSPPSPWPDLYLFQYLTPEVEEERVRIAETASGCDSLDCAELSKEGSNPYVSIYFKKKEASFHHLCLSDLSRLYLQNMF